MSDADDMDEALAEPRPKKKSKLRHGLNNDAEPATPTEASMRGERLLELEDYLRECVGIDPLQLNDEFIRIPGDLAYWNARYARALRTFLMAKVDKDITRGRLEPILRAAIINAGGKPTEKQIDGLIDSNQSYIDICHALVDAEVEKNECYGALDAIRAKKEMLISLGAHLRAEMEHDPLLRDQVVGSRGERSGRG